MLGAIMFGVMGCICIHGLFKEASENGRSKQISLQNNDKYYLDAHGVERRIDNNHRIATYVKDFENDDWIDIDLKTREILNRRPTADKERMQKWAKEAAEKNALAKQKAIEEGKYYYSSLEITEESKYFNSPNPYLYVERRTSDDFLMKLSRYNSWLRDVKSDLVLHVLYPSGNEIQEAKEENAEMIKYKSLQKRMGMNEEELRDYAIKIGALL